ncbi:MAG: DUF7535 family protein [Halobacteriota archaeon]
MPDVLDRLQQPDAPPIESVYRTVTKPARDQPSFEMDAIGWVMVLLVLVLLFPLLPVAVVFWSASRVFGFVRRQIRSSPV